MVPLQSKESYQKRFYLHFVVFNVWFTLFSLMIYKKTLVCQFDIEIVQSSISNVAFDIVICGLWFLRPNAKIDQADPQIFEFKISKI